MNELLLWLRDLTDWLRRAIGGSVSQTFQILDHVVAPEGECEAWLICNEDRDCDLAGMTACWFIRHKFGSKDFIILCFNIAQIKEAYRTSGDGFLPNKWRRKFEVNARLQLKLQRNIGGSHLFMVCSVEKEAKVVRFTPTQSIEYKSINCEGCYSVDLQGASVAWMGVNGSATKIVKAVVERILQIPSVSSGGFSWEEVVLSLSDPTQKHTWLTWLEDFCRNVKRTRIDAEHILQPPITKAHFQKKRTSNPD